MRGKLRIGIIAISAVGLFGLLSPSPAGAAGTGGSCAAKAGVTLSPGISSTPSSGTFASQAGTGTLACVGLFGNKQVAGPGVLTFSGKYGNLPRLDGKKGDDCDLGAGSGTLKATKIPVVGGGTITVLGSFKFQRVGANVQISGTVTVKQGKTTLGTGSLTGDLAFAPTTGNCAQTPVTAATVAGGAVANG